MDRISNMLSSIKNCSMTGRSGLDVIHTRECEHVAKVLKEAGYLTEVKTFKPEGAPYKMLHLGLSVGAVIDTKRVSKPGRRVYKTASELGKLSNKLATYVVSTSRGIMTGDDAKKKKLGGEVICRAF